jgi:hypothetical protein
MTKENFNPLTPQNIRPTDFQCDLAVCKENDSGAPRIVARQSRLFGETEAQWA